MYIIHSSRIPEPASNTEPRVLYLLGILMLTVVVLMVVLWVGTYLFQGYIYLEPSQSLYWQAPAAAALLGFGYSIWSLAIASSTGANSQNIPIDTIFRFSPREDMLARPAPRIWAIKLPANKSARERKEEETIEYKSVRDNQKQFHYVDTTLTPRPWQRQDVIAVELEKADGKKIRFTPAEIGQGEYRQFVSKDGWVMHEFEGGPTGLPIKFSLGRMILNLFFNFGHLFAWFIALWLILRFQWGHAAGLALVIWGLVTVVFLPMLLTYSGYVAQLRQVTTG